MQMFPHPKPQPEPEFPLVENTFAPEMLITGVAGMSLINGLITMTLESLHCDHSKTPPPVERVVVARLAMPATSAQALLIGLSHFLGQHGLNPLQHPQETRQ